MKISKTEIVNKFIIDGITILKKLEPQPKRKCMAYGVNMYAKIIDEYDENGNIVKHEYLPHHEPGNKFTSALELYSYSPSGKLLGVNQDGMKLIIANDYDEQDRLITTTHDFPYNLSRSICKYEYISNTDKVLKKTATSIFYDGKEINNITEYKYDNRGNMIKGDFGYCYKYDDKNRIVKTNSDLKIQLSIMTITQ